MTESSDTRDLGSGVFRKSGGSDPDFFAAEAAGLRWLADAGAPVVSVISVSADHIDLEHLDSVRATAEAAVRFGAELARMHDTGASTFGATPAGYTGKQFIGNRRLSSITHPTWGAFYAAERVLPYLEASVVAGNLTRADDTDTRAACALIASGVFDDGAPPARLHGDLWNGNVLWTPDGAVMIDPAAHGGHRETDLAMLALFGVRHLDSIITGYESVTPLRAGWRARIPIHQLHPLAVHAAGHGPGYGRELGQAARAALRLGG